ncbi:MAG: DUF2341 domain-containing protein [Candidatus Hermodarchaeota archaeon]
MIKKRICKKKKKFLLIFLIFFFNLTSIIFIPSIVIDSNNKSENSNNSINDITSFIRLSNGLQNVKYFNYYKVITIDHTKVNGTSNLINFPLLISLLDSDLKHDVQPDGDDIAFYNGSEWLDHEIEKFNQNYDETYAQLIAWVRIPILYYDNDTTIYMYYGNSTMESQENPEGVWDSNYKGVWHLSEDPSGSSPQMKDSTSNHNHGTVNNLNTSDQVSGQIDGSIDFDDATDYINCSDHSSLNVGSGDFSLSLWFNYDGVTQGFLAGKGAYIGGIRYSIFIVDTASDKIKGEIDDGIDYDGITTTERYDDNTWHHVELVRDGNYLRLYLDGQENSGSPIDITDIGSLDNPQPFYINTITGSPGGGPNPPYSTAKLDEVRVSMVARSADLIATEFNNQNDTNNFYSVSTAQKILSISDFDFYKEITIDHTKVAGSSDLLNFPVLISIMDSDLQDHTQPDGDDIAFYADGKWLDHEIEAFNQTYDETHAQLIAWVRVPILYHDNNTIIYMYYGNSKMGPLENPSDVWNSNYKGVWHLGDGVMNPSSSYYDSTINDNNGKAINSPINNTTSKIDGGVSFDDSNERAVKISHSTSLQFISNFSISAWFRSTDSDGDVGLIMNKWSGEESKRNYWLGKLNQNDFAFYVDNDSNVLYGWNNLKDGDWHYVVATANSTTLVIYIDGSLVATNSWDGISLTGDADLYIGKAVDTIDQEFNGDIDEIHVLDTILDLDWISTEYNNQYNPNNFYSVSSAKQTLSIYDFQYHKDIKINHTKVSGSSDLLNFPVLISILDSDLKNHTQPDGDDIAFYADGKWLDHEIEIFNQTYDETHAQFVAWVRIPSLSWAVDTNITMYYGNSTMESRENPEGVWDDDYCFVLHMDQDPSESEILDSTSNGFDFDVEVSGSMTSDDLVNGQTGKALAFDGVDDYIYLNVSKGFSGPTDKMTFEFWLMFPDGWTPAPRDYLGAPAIASGDPYLSFYDNFEFHVETDSGYMLESTQTNFSAGTWYHFSAVWDGTGAGLHRIYISGVIDKNGPSRLGNHAAWNTFSIGAEDDYDDGPGGETPEHEIKATLSEFRLSKVIRSEYWIATEYNNQYDPTSFFTISSEKQIDDKSPTYSNLTESSDPLELGETEIIQINVSDPSGINQVLIEFEGDNDTMTNIGGDTWQYDSWTPSSVGNYTYTIWMEDNYHNWNSTMGTIEVLDRTPPTYSNLIESADPLQLGQNETIEITVFDLSGVNQTLLEYDSINHSMIQDGNKWSWSKWKPPEGGHPYKIYMQDNQNNWNMTSGDITVIISYAPIIENLTESEDPLELGNDLIITVDVYDVETNVSTVLIELDGINRTMSNISLYRYEYIWNASEYIERGYSIGLPRIVNYKIYANDTDNNWNSHQADFQIKDETPPAFSALFESDDPLEFGNKETITINCTDLAGINEVIIEFEGGSYPMNNTIGNTWEYDSWLPESIGNYTYIIWCEDKTENWNNISGNILVQDTTFPTFSNLFESSNPIEIGTPLLISIKATDFSGIKQVLIEYENWNYTMQLGGGDVWQYSYWMPTIAGNYSYKIYIQDYNNLINSTNGLFMVFQDTTSPEFWDLTESSNPTEIGTPLLISIKATDFSGIKQVLIEYENWNYTMQLGGGDVWQYSYWMPTIAGNYSYKIYIQDYNNLINSTNGLFMVFQDTTSPVFWDLTESSNLLQLGDTEVITIDADDKTGINQVLIEIGGQNHSMIRIYGITWQNNSWKPTSIGIKNYTIYIEDNNGNWNSTTDFITVQDTIPPNRPEITISWSGKASDIITFVWSKGSDPSGISYYILIIDNESNPETTPGYVYKFNITNTGNESVYYELPEILPPGQYWYFLAQIDGVGLPSEYDSGTFTVINPYSNNDFVIYLIIVIILASAIASITAIVLVRKKLKKDIAPPRVKIPFKIISSHLNKLSNAYFEVQTEKIQSVTDEEDIETRINKVKSLGEELFAEGAYLEAQKQFKVGRDLLMNLGREEEAKLFSELLSGIEGLIEEREKRLETLEQAKLEGNVEQVFDLYHEIIAISKKLRDPDTASFYQSELINYFQKNINFIDLENYRYELNQKAGSLIENNIFEIAAQLYEKCEIISQLFVQLGKEEEISTIEEFKNKKEECLKNLK